MKPTLQKEQVLQYLQTHGNATSRDLADALGISINRMCNILRQLEAQKRVAVEGRHFPGTVSRPLKIYAYLPPPPTLDERPKDQRQLSALAAAYGKPLVQTTRGAVVFLNEYSAHDGGIQYVAYPGGAA